MFTKRFKSLGIILACSSDQVLEGDFDVLLDKKEANMLQIEKELKLEMDHLMSWILSQKGSSNKYQFFTKLYEPTWMVCQVQDTSRKNIEIKYLMCQIPIKILKRQATLNSS